MARLINADAVYKILESYEIRKETIGNPLSDWEYGYNCGIERAESEIECAPTVEAEPVKHGEWIDEGYYADYTNASAWRCSECGWHMIGYSDELFRYCPSCGAKMKGAEE